MGAYQKRYIALEVFYLGTAYHGFASQADTDRTVEVSHGCQCMLARLGSGKATASSQCLVPVNCSLVVICGEHRGGSSLHWITQATAGD